MADGTDSCAPSLSLHIEPDHEDAEGKLCWVWKVPISIHTGKPSIGKCFGGAFAKAFEVLFMIRAVGGLTSKLQVECTKARDRGATPGMNHVEGQLIDCKD